MVNVFRDTTPTGCNGSRSKELPISAAYLVIMGFSIWRAVVEQNYTDFSIFPDHARKQLPEFEIRVWKRVADENDPLCLHQFNSCVLPDELNLKIP